MGGGSPRGDYNGQHRRLSRAGFGAVVSYHRLRHLGLGVGVRMMREVNLKFAQHVTSIAFNLQLSRPQIIKLVDVATRPKSENGGIFTGRRDLYRILGVPDASVQAGRILEEKGLVFAPNPKYPGLYDLTEPGKLVFQLLQMAGLVQRIEDKAAERVDK